MDTSFNTLTLVEAIDALKTKKTTSVALVEACYAQIEKYDPQIKAFLALNKTEALKDARDADNLIAKLGESAFEKKPLLGIPYACKDNFNTYGIETTASSNILKGYFPPYESTVTKKLKEAGAIMLGKTNMDAFAHGSSTETSDYAKTTNPWNYDRVPGGSSGGSASAVSADMCIFAIGSETSGSIRGPAAWCGISGIKPTYGRVSRYGVIAMASSTDSPGPLCKTIQDCAYVLEVIAGQDNLDATSSPNPTEKYSQKLDEVNLKGFRIGIPKSYFDLDLQPGVRKSLEDAIKTFKDNGATIVDIDLLDPKYSIAVYTIIQRSEVSSNLARFDGIRYGKTRDAFGFEAKKRSMLGAYTLSAGYYDQYYSKAQKVRTLLIEDFNKAFEKVDIIIGPTMPCVALPFGEGDKSAMFGELMDVLANPSSMAGLTAISIPTSLSEELPVGMQLIGPMFSESRILSLAHQFQKLTNFHKERPKLK